jgi:hypothetical protein
MEKGQYSYETHVNAVISHLPSKIDANGIENFGLLNSFGKLR